MCRYHALSCINKSTVVMDIQHKLGVNFSFRMFLNDSFIRENLILRYELKGKARTRPDILWEVLGSSAQCCPFEASEQKCGQKPKSTPKEIEL